MHKTKIIAQKLHVCKFEFACQMKHIYLPSLDPFCIIIRWIFPPPETLSAFVILSHQKPPQRCTLELFLLSQVTHCVCARVGLKILPPQKGHFREAEKLSLLLFLFSDDGGNAIEK